jgi:AmmeMemoRadiSam system protein B/AmmeMemoRadiSam system protein A
MNNKSLMATINHRLLAKHPIFQVILKRHTGFTGLTITCILSLLMATSVQCSTNSNQTMNYSHPGTGEDSVYIRKPAVAGSFYPSSPADLKNAVRAASLTAVQRKSNALVKALIVPHAGYIYSGGVAASAYNQLDNSKIYKRIFIIGSSHRAAFEGASVFCRGNYSTPLGIVQVDLETARQLVKDNPGTFLDNAEVQLAEHSLEVQLPFLQEKYGSELRIVPILIGSHKYNDCYKIAQGLRKWFTPDNLFIISTDFSHYPSFKDATITDKETANAICSNSVREFLETIERHDRSIVPGLVTSICGWTSALTLLYLTAGNEDLEYVSVQYKNSGDSPYGDKDKVVGYEAIEVISRSLTTGIDPSRVNSATQPEGGEFSFSPEEKKALLDISKETLHRFVRKGAVPQVDTADLPLRLKNRLGAFVTLRKNGELRGCIGQFNPHEQLWKLVQDMTIASASRDTRFSPVVTEELKDITIEISVLSPLKKITSPDEIVLGRHGIYIRQGASSGTYLPQVASETGWTLEEFLGHCSRDKAGIGWEGWKTADLYTYEALILEEEGSANH